MVKLPPDRPQEIDRITLERMANFKWSDWPEGQKNAIKIALASAGVDLSNEAAFRLECATEAGGEGLPGDPILTALRPFVEAQMNAPERPILGSRDLAYLRQ